MKKLMSVLLAVALCASLAALAEYAPEGDKVRVGVSWVADFENGEPDEDTQAYIDAVTKAGGEPVYLDQITDEESAKAVLSGVDCVILTGGEDIGPAYYGEEPDEKLEYVNDVRDVSDYWLTKVALDIDIPILCTCRGLQMMNVVCGGTLYQDIPSQFESDVEVSHRDPAGEDFAYHNITIEDADSLVAQAMGGAGQYEVNSWHHQGVKDVGDGLVVTAVADDGMVEALELADPDQFMLAVQYHPEWHVADGNDAFLPYFTMLIDACAEEEEAAA